MLLLMELLKDWPCTVSGGEFRTPVMGITENSSKVKEGFIFVARKGTHDDGTFYIEEAIGRGASVVIIDRMDLTVFPADVPVVIVPECRKFLSYASARLAGNPSKRLKVIAVTGTNGKTTVTHFIGQLLKRVGVRAAVIGTTGFFIDSVKTKCEIPHMTTLPPEYLHPLLGICEEEGVTHVVLEASSLGLSRNRLDHCEIDIGIVLNIGNDHYDEHGGKRAYLNAKKQLVQMAKTIIVNLDDEQCVQLVENALVRLVYFGQDSSAGFHVSDERLELTVLGHYNKMNAMAAVTALIVLGYPMDEIFQYTSTLKLPEGRLQQLERDGVKVFVDYAHTPDALQAVLHTLSNFCYGRLITVFGCGGERDRGKRSEMGELAVLYSSSVIVTSDNPRSEKPLAIIEDIMKGFGGDCSVVEAILDRKNAIRKAIFSAAPGDIVLIAGKGHEKTQHTANGLFPFSDYKEAEHALLEKTVLDLKYEKE
ncbi:UDP-N-acetylmuramoyl-L-alanyl-D-glutamate--2,6-diaminopimelate ligase [Sporosarcina limicola]|uniref:UDP-N-acetylmuramoyl-L-alanyl-D-glutamate--2,6-diaminopimelate ligase n=1 Tax=Sporosarcina limicola TaxID=34101 RepID=A0A927MFA3_9BACL|nr:UDP-N-acetylmuramoyl-L-alanyl-D-glutamate--2,6-diaminopimelate ligase [Sporosarcina limicola]MBE1553583.1 UDP-N-acetylmuramoyl-L-alanyl-D-glutamate--2,6-diaminopimelate ligase [Sporosarcina limicola]